MEFHFRAGDERCPSTGTAATSANSETAATRVHDGPVGGDGAGYHGESSAPPPSDPDELRRREAKEMIRERMLREDAEAAKAMALEAEVRREVMEERASLLAGLAGGSETLKTAPICHESSVQAGSKLDASAAVPAKRKNPDAVVASAVFAATSSKKQKPDLTCTVCNMTATSALALQEHLRGKSHLKKAAKHLQPLPGTGHPEEDAFSLKVDGSAALPAKGKNPGGGVTSMAFVEKSCDNLSLNCTVCGITATCQKNMQDHLKGKIHMRKTALHKPDGVCSKPNASGALLPAKRKSSDVVPAASTLSAEPSSKNQKQDLTCTVNQMKMVPSPAPGEAEEEAEVEGGYTPMKFKMVTNSGISCEVVQLNGSVFCEVCKVKTPDRVTMMCHLEGSKHISKQAKQKQCEAVEPPAAVAAGGYGPGSEVVPMETNGVDGSSLLCELCNVKVPSERVMQSHLSGRKHTNKAKAAAVGVGAYGNGSGSETVSMEANGVRRLDDGFLLCELCNVKAPSECVMRDHLSGRKHTNKQKATADAGAGQEVKKAAAAATSSSKEAASIVNSSKGATSIDVNGSDDNVKKPAAGEMEVVVSSAKPRVDGAARVSSVAPMEVNEQAEAGDGTAKADEQEKADSEEEGAVEMDGGAAVTIGSSSKEAASIVVNGSDDSVKKPATGETEVVASSATPQVDVTAPVCAPDAGDGTAKADEQEKADAEEEEAVEMDGGAAVTGEEYIIQVQGKLFVTLRQADGSLSCGLCGVHGCDKGGMMDHLYTRDHWRRARLAEEKKPGCPPLCGTVPEEEPASNEVKKDGDGVPVTGGEAHVDN
ncbi:uncharacterized protein LOC123448875 [Hordeum vulgare subsp. vulgare]|uniref:C2H2-type domain-containing protein n=1 Tax=Hordeum vulgare subsp. vulgare TaxID=112509 RepID=A0A8I6W7U6_HORVV|nr:uncharacterized protein LOC123448875 [Hordeum vulgare subsp. vulgare]